jgi:hypothetical protein
MRYMMILAVASGCSRAPLPIDMLTGHWAMPTDGQSTVGYMISPDERALTLNWDEVSQVFTRE